MKKVYKERAGKVFDEHNQDVPVCIDYTAHDIKNPLTLDYRSRCPICGNCHGTVPL
jgi:hypothetical protein